MPRNPRFWGLSGSAAVSNSQTRRGPDDAGLVDLGRQRQLDEDPVDGRVDVELADELEQLVGLRVLGEVVALGVVAELLTRLHLRADVDLRGGVFADEDDVFRLGGAHNKAFAGGGNAAIEDEDDGRVVG